MINVLFRSIGKIRTTDSKEEDKTPTDLTLRS